MKIEGVSPIVLPQKDVFTLVSSVASLTPIAVIKQFVDRAIQSVFDKIFTGSPLDSVNFELQTVEPNVEDFVGPARAELVKMATKSFQEPLHCEEKCVCELRVFRLSPPILTRTGRGGEGMGGAKFSRWGCTRFGGED